jgi:hypothetical protein
VSIYVLNAFGDRVGGRRARPTPLHGAPRSTRLINAGHRTARRMNRSFRHISMIYKQLYTASTSTRRVLACFCTLVGYHWRWCEVLLLLLSLASPRVSLRRHHFWAPPPNTPADHMISRWQGPKTPVESSFSSSAAAARRISGVSSQQPAVDHA